MDPAATSPPDDGALARLVARLATRPPLDTSEPAKLPWNDPGFSERMLREHLDQSHDHASRAHATVDAHVAWIFEELLGGRPGSVLDLGCGPGLYTERLAARGCRCLGIDFSPASIRHARLVAEERGLSCTYALGDVRAVDFGAGHDLAMCVFGELNTFTREDAAKLLARVRRSLRDGGTLLLEVHTYASVVAAGTARPSWYASSCGLFSDRPHLVLSEHAWSAAAATARTCHHVLDDTGAVDEYGESLHAYSDEEYRHLLVEAGFTEVRFHAGMGPVSHPDMTVVTARAR